MEKRGQSALEYLMTYGWALIVLVIVVAALFFLGILNPSTYQGKTCTGFNKTAYAGEHDFNGTRFQAKFTNNAGFAVDLNNVSSTVAISGTSVNAPQLVIDDNTDVAPGASFILTANGFSGFSTGTTFNATVTLRYSNSEGTPLVQTETGNCTGTVP